MTDTDNPDTDPDSDPSGGYYADCDGQSTPEACAAESDLETECAWLVPTLFADDDACTANESAGFCITAQSDFDCGSSGPACGGMEATPYFRDVEGGTEVVIVPWQFCGEYLPPLDFAACEAGDGGFADEGCNCACDGA
jgi:hypothetical protein